MQSVDYELVIGDKRLSSWSLRPWLLMKAAGIPFRETPIRLRQDDSAANIARHSPSGKIPVLKTGTLTIWDSLAIAEFLAETHPEKPIWPQDREARAMARSVSAEMHSGFYSLRSHMPMDLNTVYASWPVNDDVAADIGRVVAIWRACRERHGAGGEFLFGAFCAADAMFAPVATRFRTYGTDLSAFGDDGTASRYMQAILSMPEMTEWGQGAAAEI